MESQEEVWESLAGSWHSFRQRPVFLAESLAARWKPGRVLDIGCGNGRNLIPFLNNGFKGVCFDFSKNMLKNAEALLKKKGVWGKVELKQGNMIELPFEGESFDYILNLVALHNLTKPEAYLAVDEMRRVLKKKGMAVIAVWNKLQPRFFFRRKNVYIPWRIGKETYQRYYYLYTYWELKKLLEQRGFEVISHSGIFERNLYFIVRKSD